MALAELLGRGMDDVFGEGDDEGEAVTVLAPQPASTTAITTQPARVLLTQAETLFGPDRYSAPVPRSAWPKLGSGPVWAVAT